jgi:hypothetical protein
LQVRNLQVYNGRIHQLKYFLVSNLYILRLKNECIKWQIEFQLLKILLHFHQILTFYSNGMLNYSLNSNPKSCISYHVFKICNAF